MGSIEGRLRIRRVLLALVLLAVVGYALFQARDLIRGPVITVLEPRTGSTLSESLVEIAGRAQNISSITLNERAIFVDEEGYFREQLLLPEGYTIMTLEAEDRFGRTTTETLELVRK